MGNTVEAQLEMALDRIDRLLMQRNIACGVAASTAVTAVAQFIFALVYGCA